MLRLVLCQDIFVFKIFYSVILAPSPKAGDDNLMQEINQNLAEEVRIVECHRFVIIFWQYVLFPWQNNLVFPLQAGLNITHICLPPDSSEDEVTTTSTWTLRLLSSLDLLDLLASLGGGWDRSASSCGWTLRGKITFPSGVNAPWSAVQGTPERSKGTCSVEDLGCDSVTVVVFLWLQQ